ncbi:PAS-domain containing protein [Pelomonas sp. APW6]|uniref:histidine kinase n=1 Tax=Roseateles subflavus TaxID=3053353 RepID=A0ABT7LIL2_9BURK|nr:PAS-domain containing protein [Pelomonas sp. APW6]MDL5032274.1 PAS-domain containing protein [Pelomonas sp. APW6]
MRRSADIPQALAQGWRTRRWLLPLLVGLLGLATTAWTTRFAQRSQDAASDARFDEASEHVVNDIKRRLSLAQYGFQGVRGVFAANPEAGYREFQRYVQSLDLAHEFPGVTGFGLISRVAPDGLPALERQLQAEGASAFQVKTSGSGQDLLYIARYIEPLKDNASSWGSDIGAEPRRRHAIDSAIRSGRPTFTQPITLVRDGKAAPGFLLIQALYRPGASLETIQERGQALLGLVYAPIVVEQALQGVSRSAGGQLSVRVLAAEPGAGGSPLFAEDGSDTPARLPRVVALADTLPLRLGDQTLQVRLTPTQLFEAFETDSPLALPIAGTLSSLLLAVLAWVQITARDRAEVRAGQLTADVRRLAAVAERTANAVICFDPDMHVTWVNDGFVRSSGYTLDEVRGRPPWEFLSHPGSDPAAQQALAEARLLGQATRLEICNRHKDGHLYWIDILLQPIHDERGRLEGFIEVGIDITERKHREALHAQARGDSDALLAAVARHAIVSVADPAGRITSINPLMAEVSGYAEAELLGMDHRLLKSGIHPAGFWQAMWTELKAGRSWRGQVCNRRKDGTLFWVDCIISPSLNSEGGIDRYVSIGMDVTEARKASDALQMQHTRLTNIIEGTAAGTWDLQAEEQRIDYNSRCMSMLGHHGEEPGSLTLASWLSRIHPQDRDAVRRRLEDHLKGLVPTFDAELRLRHRAGHWVWVQSTGRIAVRNARGEPLWVTGLQIDITARKLAELQLRQQRQLLDRAERLAGIGAWEQDLATQRLDLSDQTRRLLQLESPDPLGLEHLLNALSESDAAQLRRGMQAALAGSVGWDFEFELTRPDGTTLWLRSVGEAEFDDSGPVRLVGAFADISQRRSLEAETQRSHRLLMSVLENLPCALSVFDSDLRLVAHNTQFRELLGFPDALFDRETVTFDSIIRFNALRGEYGEYADADEAEALVQVIVKRAREPTFHQFERTRPDGRTLEVRGAPMPGGGFVTTYVDVTERRRLEQIRERLTEQMSAMLEALPCGLTVYDKDLVVTLHNERFTQLYGLDPALWDQARTTLADIVTDLHQRGDYGELSHAEAQAVALANARASLAGPCTRERYRPDADLHLEVRSHPLPSGGYVSTYMDVTAQRRTLQHLHRAESLLRSAIDTINEAFVLYDPQDRLVLCNDKYRELYAAIADLLQPGIDFETLVRTGVQRGQYPEALGREEEWLAERLATHRRGGTSHVQALNDGRWIRVIEQRMADGHTVGFRVDITDLIVARKAAENAAVAKGQFLANMSHEIRTPMNAILGLLQLLDKTRLDARQKGYTDKLAGAARSLLGLLNDILDFSKIETGKMTMETRPFALDPLLRDVGTIVGATVQGKPVRLYFDLDPALPPVLEGDALRLQQVLVNLAGNAVKFTPEGSVVISLRPQPDEHGGPRLRVAVRDSGIGIASEHQERIFSGFSQAEASTTRRFGGTGLGLAISARLVELMGSRIAVESAPGQGSCFSFDLPLTGTGVLDAQQAHEAEPPHARPALLVAEDGQDLARLASLLRQAGLQPLRRVEADALEEALDPALATSPGTPPATDGEAPVLVLDTLNPQADLGDWAQRLLARHPALRVLVLTTAEGQHSLAAREPTLATHGLRVMVMPVTPGQLGEALSQDATATASAPDAPAPQRLQGARLLLVEDNATNQQVALELLGDEGAQIVLAENGALAVERLRHQPGDFDAVLMDVQMPVMDGLTASRLIRGELGLATLPIIAMTANAMAQDQADCQAAGMTAFVGKPLDLNLLVQTLHRCCPSLAGPPPTAVTPTPAAADAPAAAPSPDEPAPPAESDTPAMRRLRERLRQIRLDPALLAEASAQGFALQEAMERVMGKAPLLVRMCEGLQQQVQALPAVLEQAREANDLRGAQQTLHSIKGLAASLGAEALAADFRLAEQACAAGRWPDADALAALLRQGALGAEALLGFARRLGPPDA